MIFARTLVALCAVGALGACATSQTAQPRTAMSRSHCAGLASEDQDVSGLFAADNVRRVEPLYEHAEAKVPSRAAIRNPSRHVMGANLYVPAQRESSAYVERVLSCHAAKAASAGDHPNDPLRVAGVRDVDVSEVGTQLRIAISASDPQAGRAVLERAQALRSSPATNVEVQQVSAAPKGQAAF